MARPLKLKNPSIRHRKTDTTSLVQANSLFGKRIGYGPLSNAVKKRKVIMPWQNRLETIPILNGVKSRKHTPTSPDPHRASLSTIKSESRQSDGHRKGTANSGEIRRSDRSAGSQLLDDDVMTEGGRPKLEDGSAGNCRRTTKRYSVIHISSELSQGPMRGPRKDSQNQCPPVIQKFDIPVIRHLHWRLHAQIYGISICPAINKPLLKVYDTEVKYQRKRQGAPQSDHTGVIVMPPTSGGSFKNWQDASYWLAVTRVNLLRLLPSDQKYRDKIMPFPGEQLPVARAGHLYWPETSEPAKRRGRSYECRRPSPLRSFMVVVNRFSHGMVVWDGIYPWDVQY